MPPPTYVGAIDQGTTGTRFMVFDHDGKPVAEAYQKHEQIQPESGLLEHDPEEIWTKTKRVTQEALSSRNIRADQLAAIGVANQRETALLWDAATGDPLYNAIGWQDRRTEDRVEGLRDTETGETLRRKTGLEPDAYFSASKVEWLLDNADPPAGSDPCATLRDCATAGEVMFGTIDSWLLYNLTGVHATDVTNASRTMLFDVHRMDWDEDLLETFRVPPEILPAVVPSSHPERFGETDLDGYFDDPVPVTGVMGDQQAALFGQTCFDAGDAKTTFGTGAFFLLNTGETPVESENGLLTTVAYQRAGEPPRYALEGPIFVAGAALEWLERVDLVRDTSEVGTLARSVEDTEGVYVVPSLAGLGAPHWNANARGTVVGMSEDSTRAHIVRAALEAIAYQTRDVKRAMLADADADLGTFRIDGGAATSDFFSHLLADVVQSELVRPEVDDTTALGAVYAAGLAVDYWETLEDLEDNWRAGRTFQPRMESATAADRYQTWQKAVSRAVDW